MGLLDDKVAIVTGAGTGIGKAIAQAFAKEGATIVLASRNEQNLREAATELGDSYGATTLVVPTDVTVEPQVVALFEGTVRAFGRVDILVNNSGVLDETPLDELPLETWQRVVDVNLTGPFLCSREAMKIMKPQGGGRIINIGSISAQVPRANTASYTTTKHAITGLTKSIALEGRDHGVIASCLHPGNTATALGHHLRDETSVEPEMQAHEVAATALTMAALPPHVNMLEAIVLPVGQAYLGRG